MTTQSSDRGAAPGPGEDGQADGPLPGSPVTLMVVGEADSVVAGTLRSWDASAHGLVVDATVAVSSASRQSLAHRKVWVSARTVRTRNLVVLAGRVVPVEQRDEVALTGMITLATESRRDSVRAPLDRPAVLVFGEERLDVRVLDLSRGGCRVVVDRTEDVEIGPVELQVELSGEAPLRAAAHVLRVDPASGQVTVHFDRLSARDARRVDDEVFSTLSAAGG